MDDGAGDVGEVAEDSEEVGKGFANVEGAREAEVDGELKHLFEEVDLG